MKRWQTGIMAGCLVILLATSSFLAYRTWTLTHQRHSLQTEARDLHRTIDAATVREAGLNQQLTAAKTQITQLTGSATGKDATIAGLQADDNTKTAQIASITAQRDVLKSCLDGVTLALVQLTDNGNAAAQSTLNGVRSTCQQANVLV